MTADAYAAEYAAAYALVVAEHGPPSPYDSPERTAWFAKHRGDFHDAVRRVRSGDTAPLTLDLTGAPS